MNRKEDLKGITGFNEQESAGGSALDEPGTHRQPGGMIK